MIPDPDEPVEHIMSVWEPSPPVTEPSQDRNLTDEQRIALGLAPLMPPKEHHV